MSSRRVDDTAARDPREIELFAVVPAEAVVSGMIMEVQQVAEALEHVALIVAVERGDAQLQFAAFLVHAARADAHDPAELREDATAFAPQLLGALAIALLLPARLVAEELRGALVETTPGVRLRHGLDINEEDLRQVVGHGEAVLMTEGSAFGHDRQLAA